VLWDPGFTARLYCTCHQCCGTGSVRIRNFLKDPEPDLELEVMDPDPAPELDLNLTKMHTNIINLIIMTLKIHL
jgi:hypothetical protein